MIILSSTQSLQLITTTTPSTALNFIATYADSGDTTLSGYSVSGTFNNTPTTCVNAPSGSVRRSVNDVLVFNPNAASITLQVQIVDNGVTRTIDQKTINYTNGETSYSFKDRFIKGETGATGTTGPQGIQGPEYNPDLEQLRFQL
jgi:hypothetical protein